MCAGKRSVYAWDGGGMLVRVVKGRRERGREGERYLRFGRRV